MKEQTNNLVDTNNVWMIGAGMLVTGLIIGFLVGWLWQQNSSQVRGIDEDFQKSNATTSASTTVRVPVPEVMYQSIDTPAFVSIDDQRAGSLVFVKNTEIGKPTWIAVRELSGDTVGNILGAGMVTTVSEDVPVTLLRPTKAGQKYAIFLYQDDGDGRFDFKKDLLIMQNNLPVATMFTAQ